MAERQCCGSKAFGSVCGRDAVCLTDLAYESIEGRHSDFLATNRETADVPTAVKSPSANVPDMDDHVVLLENNAGWTQDINSVDPCFVETRGLYRGEPTALKLSAPRTSSEAVKIGR